MTIIEADTRSQASDWRIWQVIDSAFPAGGLAHSAGLEAVWQAGWVRSTEEVEAFLRESLEQITHGALPFVGAAARGDDVDTLDAYLDTLLINHVANRASRRQGMTFLVAANEIFDEPGIRTLRNDMSQSAKPGHYAVMFGAVLRRLSIEPPLVARMYLYLSLRGTLSAGVRLGIMGPHAAQRLLVKMDATLEKSVGAAADLAIEDACQTAPLLELVQMGQDRLYSRLFQS